MSFIESVGSVLGNYAKFDGRALRSEYWWFQAFNILVLVALGLVLVVFASAGIRNNAVGSLVLSAYGLFALGTIIPNLAVTVRRLHDTNRSGWWILISLVPYIGALVLIVMLAMEGTRGVNQYGPPYGLSGDIRTANYRGSSPSDTWAIYSEDARRAAAAGYEPVSQQWRRDAYGDYLEVVYNPTPRTTAAAAAWQPGPQPAPMRHPFDGPPPDVSAGGSAGGDQGDELAN